MLEIGGVDYVIDLKVLDKVISTELKSKNIVETETIKFLDSEGELVSTEIRTKEFERTREVDMAKYETIRTLLDVVFSTNEEVDDELGVERALNDLPLPFKLSFNTLLEYGIIKEIQ
jgi:hypothetical protein